MLKLWTALELARNAMNAKEKRVTYYYLRTIYKLQAFAGVYYSGPSKVNSAMGCKTSLQPQIYVSCGRTIIKYLIRRDVGLLLIPPLWKIISLFIDIVNRWGSRCLQFTSNVLSCRKHAKKVPAGKTCKFVLIPTPM